MSKEAWVAVLTFVSALIVAAMKWLPVPPDLIPWLTFAVVAVQLALSIFFGVPAIKGWLAAHAAPKARP